MGSFDERELTDMEMDKIVSDNYKKEIRNESRQ